MGLPVWHNRFISTPYEIAFVKNAELGLGKHEVARWLGRVINGWLNYYAVPGTPHELKKFVRAVKQLLLRTMRRRSQNDRFSWPELERLVSICWPKPTIRHPWPSQRLTVNTQGRSRSAALAHFSDVVQYPKSQFILTSGEPVSQWSLSIFTQSFQWPWRS